MDPFLQSVAATVRSGAGVPHGTRVLVAVSGGLDSVVLLHTLRRLEPELGWNLLVAHFNHQLRGEEADADQRWVARLSTRLGLRCVVGAGDVRRHAKAAGVSIEMAARELRHAFLAATAVRERCRAIATAHHADDQVELFLLRACRGAGGEGLGGMLPCAPFPGQPSLQLLRPLLSRTRDDIRLWARKHRILHREDRSNASLDPLRNRVRLRVLPEILRQLGASAPEAIRRSMELVRSEAEALAAQAREWLQSAGHRARYVGLPVGLQRRIVIEQLFALGVTPDFAKIEALRSQPGVAVTFDAGARVKRTRTGFLRRCPEPARNHVAAAAAATGVDLDLSARRGRRPFGAIQLRWERRPPPSAEWIRRHKAGVEVFDAASVGDRLHLRHWRPGDRFQPLGFKTPSKLQNLLVNRKVPATRRHHLAIAQHPDGRLVWVQGLPPGHDFRVVARTRQCLVLRWSSAR